MKAILQVEKNTYNPGKISDKLFALASVKALEDETERSPLDIVCIIDVSKSMEDGKLELVKASLSFILENLKEEDTMGIVEFGVLPRVILKRCPMTQETKFIAKTKISRMTPFGCTNLSGGLFKGLEMMKDYKSTGVVLLFTDGKANRGITNTEALKNATQDHLKDCEKVKILTFGFGEEHEPEMLEALSSLTKGGNYYYVPDHEAIGPQFAECLGGLMSLVAQNVQICLPLRGKGYKLLSVLGDHKKQFNEYNEYVIEIGDLYSEQQKDIVFEIIPFSENFDIEMYFSCYLLSEGLIEREIIVLESFYRESPSPPKINADVRKHYNRVFTSDVMRKVIEMSENNFEGAKDLLRKLLKHLEEDLLVEDDLTPLLIEDVEQCLRGFLNTEVYQKGGIVALRAFSYSHANQRSRTYTTSLQEQLINGLTQSKAYENACESSIQKRHSSYRNSSTEESDYSSELTSSLEDSGESTISYTLGRSFRLI